MTRKQRILVDGLGGQLRVDAGRPEEEEPLDAVLEGGVHDVDLDPQVVAEEVDGIGVVGEDAADLGGGEDDIPWLGLGEERENRVPILQVQFSGGASDQVGEALRLETAPDRGAYEAP